MVLNRLSDELHDGSFLLSAGFHDSQHDFHEAVAAFALSSKTQFAPDDSVTQTPLSVVVRGRDFRIPEKSPQMIAMLIQLFAHPMRSGAEASQQKRFHFLADRPKVSSERLMLDRSIATAGVFREQLLRFTHQIVTEAFELMVIRIDQCLKITVQMSPAPLQNSVLEIHLRPIAIDAAGEVQSNGFGQHGRFSSRTQHEHGVSGGHERPQPRLHSTASEWCFIDRKVRLIGQRLSKFIVAVFEHCCRAVFQFTHMTGTARYLTNIGAECRCLAT